MTTSAASPARVVRSRSTAAGARLELANQLDLAFSTLSYWLTDLSLSLQTASERHAATHRTRVNALLAQLAQSSMTQAQLLLQRGGRASPETAAQLLGYVPQFTPVINQQIKQFCK